MESFSGDTEESTEDIAGRKKSKLKSLKARLFGRSKRTVGKGNSKLSQSASDITAQKELGSDEDLVCPQGTMGSRALSHDSIFLADQILTDTEPVKVLSQENVNSKIKALQIKLQQQKMHLGPPPLVLPVRRPEELENDSLSHSPPEILGGDVTSQGALNKISSFPISSIPKPVLTKSVPLTSYLPLPLPTPFNSSSSSAVEPPLDFSSPVQFTACLDTSAARHRMSVKPRNQRASTKKKLGPTDCSSYSYTRNNVDHPESMKEEEEQQTDVREVKLETEQGKANIQLPSQCLEVAPIPSEAAPKSSKSTLTSQQANAPPGTVPSVSSQILRVKTQRPTDIKQRPHSSFIESELKDKREGGFEVQLMSQDKKNLLIKTGMTEDSLDLPSTSSSLVAFRPSSVHQQVQEEIESTRGIKRPAPGSGSFHFSITTAKNRDGERPRSGSFVEALEQAEARNNAIKRAEDRPFSSMNEKEELRDLQPKGGSFASAILKQEAAPLRNSVFPRERGDNSKKSESVTNVATDTGTVVVVVGEEVESSQKVVEEAVEAQEVQEEEGKAKFGIKLRPTSQSLKFRSDTASNRYSKTPGEQGDKQKRQEISDNATTADIQLPNTTPSGSSFPLRNNLSCTSDSTEVQTTSSNPERLEAAHKAPQEPQPTPQTASSEVSWMSLAMEKTRSLQQLFTSRFPRDFTAKQTAVRPLAQVQTVTQTEAQNAAQMQTQTVKSATPVQTSNQPSTDTVKTETLQSTSPTQFVKPAQMAAQQKTSKTSTGISFRESQTSKQSSEPQFAPQSAAYQLAQTSQRSTQSPLHSSKQTEPSSTLVQGCATQSLAQSCLSSGQQDTPQKSPWSNRSLHRTNQLTPTTSVSTVPSTTAPSPVEKQEKEISSLSRRQAVWGGSVSERAAFLEKQAEWTSPSETKVELRKTQTEVQPPGETPVSSKTISLSKGTKLDGREWVKPAESSPVKVPDRPREDKWPRKNVTSSTPSSSPTQPSVLQSMSESSQPSWMELAKRKSMAWSDKTMD